MATALAAFDIPVHIGQANPFAKRKKMFLRQCYNPLNNRCVLFEQVINTFLFT
jgi:hypothetical protein